MKSRVMYENIVATRPQVEVLHDFLEKFEVELRKLPEDIAKGCKVAWRKMIAGKRARQPGILSAGEKNATSNPDRQQIPRLVSAGLQMEKTEKIAKGRQQKKQRRWQQQRWQQQQWQQQPLLRPVAGPVAAAASPPPESSPVTFLASAGAQQEPRQTHHDAIVTGVRCVPRPRRRRLA